MKKPKKVLIGTVPHRIVYDHKIVDKAVGHTDALGVSLHKKQLIAIDERLNKEMMKETLFHEVLHCLFFCNGITAPIVKEKLLDHAEEALVSAISPAVQRFFLENPKFRRYLFGD